MRATRLFATFLGLAMALPASAERGYVDIEKRLSAEQLRATGLERLSAAELALLNQLLREEATSQAAANVGLREARAASKPAEPERVDGHLRGEFRGWSPGTRLELDNGQVWRVIEGELYARPVQAPKVTITPGLVSGWYLQVEGQSPRAKVRREK